MEDKEFSRRVGNGIKWQMITKSGKEVITGFTIDNLDTKNIEDAEGKFEEVFVVIRQALETVDSCCLDTKEERLRVCQRVCDSLKGNKLL